MNFNVLYSWWRISRQPQHRWIWYTAATIVYLAALLAPLPEFGEQGKKAFAVFCMAVFLWGTNTVPMPITGLLVLLLLPLSGALPADKTYKEFGSSALFFVLSVFILASPIMRSGLSTRLALGLLSRFGRNQRTLVAAVLVIAAFMACFISAHAVAAMLLPIVLDIVRASGAKPGSRFALATFFAMGWGAAIGANGTLLGGARAPLALEMLQKATGKTISFAEWAILSLPIVVVTLLVAYLLLLGVMRAKQISLEKARQSLQTHSKEIGPISKRETYTAGVILLTIALWVTRSDQLGVSTVGLIGVMLAFVTRVARWREVEEDVNWGIFIMYGSAIALSNALSTTDASKAMAHYLLPSWLDSPVLIFIAVVLLALVLTEFMSNAAAVAALMPVALALAMEIGLDPRAVTLGVVTSAGLGFMFPISTPAIALVATSGYAPLIKVARWGMLLDFSAFLVLIVMSKLYWPLLGLRW